jgi:hypothetical protein
MWDVGSRGKKRKWNQRAMKPSPYRVVADAAQPFESRWTLRALLSVDPDLYEAFRDQQALWNTALITGDDSDVTQQTAAMVRGWQAITRRMDGTPDDAYLLGVCPRTGTKVAIGDQTAARARVREIHGEAVIWMTPHECASLLASQQVVASLKGLFPGAELIDLYPNEPAKEDA